MQGFRVWRKPKLPKAYAMVSSGGMEFDKCSVGFCRSKYRPNYRVLEPRLVAPVG